MSIKLEANLVKVHSDDNTAERAFGYCCRLLAVREYACAQLSQKLGQKGYPAPVIELTLARLADEGWQSEQRFCESFVRSRVRKGQGEKRIRWEIGQWIAEQTLIEQAIAQEAVDWQQLCEQVLARKAVTIDSKSLNQNEKNKLQRFLQYRGFSSEQVRTALLKHEHGRGNEIENDQ